MHQLQSRRSIFNTLFGRFKKETPKALAVVISYCVFPEPLIKSVSTSGVPLRWHIHYHGGSAVFAARLKLLAMRLPHAKVFDHRNNRGLAKSWNESLSTLNTSINELAFIFNDDVYFKTGGFLSFFQFVDDGQRRNASQPRYYTLLGEETGPKALAAVCPQGMACCAINSEMFTKIGPFDETFVPAYYEDCDYFYRMRLAGHAFTLDTRALCVHERSKSSQIDDDLKARIPEIVARNGAYYLSKWGGEPDREVYLTPFNG